ncbi:prolyl oligopeptidase family serine peptidase [Sphingomonas sp. AR_OL41]|uniref:alpha/beta hydrolase family protein n=1 Tax=Sphingomonas sp. AR_OL41 TaxID=3042729 RepID=UPI0024815EA0|nr:prolyl oligopeptidase family serine peptidase [Sphingomonas sp. AR_OL41]MDH7975202.1 prolyl oligopeptidase family serine peptidase [Sphingomonas sp. AR_OL41]
MRRPVIAMVIAALLGAAAPGAAPSAAPETVATLPDGAQWKATVPANWNGTLLLWSHGYAPTLPAAEDAPARQRDALLAAGYALAGSSYADAGWALESAVPDQLATIDAFAARYGKPKRVIAWGMSMGGLVTAALVEQAPRRVDGGLAMCASIGGAVGMMNMALDGAYAFRTLLAPSSEIRLTGVDDDRINGRRVAEVLAEAQRTPTGRARVALAAVLAGLPGWTTPGSPAPAETDYAAQQAEMAKTFVMGVFLPRVDQERRGDGVFSWNSGVDYRRQLALSGRGAMVRALYHDAAIDLDADLATLNAGKRITAAPGAVRYMTAHYTPNGRPLAPLLAVQNIGDGLTSASLQQAYLDATAKRTPGRAAGLWVAGAGHCTFDTPTVLASIGHLVAKLDSGRWPARPTGFVAYTPPPMLRPCVRDGACR